MLPWRFLVLAAGALAIAALALAVLRPSAILGVSDRALAYSLGRELNAYKTKCQRRPSSDRKCEALDTSGGSVTYRVGARTLGCWNAELTADTSELAPPERLSGCINIRDHVRLGERLLP